LRPYIGYPITSIENLELNVRWDGIFHSSAYIFVLTGLFILWRSAHRKHLYWSTKLLVGSMLIGFGSFNSVEGREVAWRIWTVG